MLEIARAGAGGPAGEECLRVPWVRGQGQSEVGDRALIVLLLDHRETAMVKKLRVRWSERQRLGVVRDGAVEVAGLRARSAAARVGGRRHRSVADRFVGRVLRARVIALSHRSGAAIWRRHGRARGQRQSRRDDPRLHARAPSERRSMSSAAWVACHFTAARSPENWNRRAVASPSSRRPTKTVPTGLTGVPPSGPAMPVTASAQDAPARVATPRAIASAHCPLTAPWARRSDPGTASSSSFARREYARTPRSKYADAPGTLVRRWPRRPPVHASATARVSPRSRSMRPTTSSSVSLSRP